MTTETKSLAEQINELETNRDKLVERLDKGAEIIDTKRSQGQNVHDLEDFWIAVLRQYEATCERLRKLQAWRKHEQEEAAKAGENEQI